MQFPRCHHVSEVFDTIPVPVAVKPMAGAQVAIAMLVIEAAKVKFIKRIPDTSGLTYY